MAHQVAQFEEMAILGEGNVSGQLDADRLLIKASGTQLGTLTTDQLVEVNSQVILKSLDGADTGDEGVESLLLESRANPDALKPSVETLFHSWLLELPGIHFVGHTHPICVNQLLCSPRAEDYAKRRLFPDQIVYCGQESVLIPYVDPGLTLARCIAQEVEAFRDRTGCIPKTILLENHGLIAIGGSAKQVEAALMMAEKAARVFVGATTAGGPIFMPVEQVERIGARSDEHYRQRMLETN
ncbi:short chain dehydrogenase [Adhaeretor mobilis]|uniref:Short chain dehydrogenase n=2 Tax=Adhaeretor mobilis TaxID=1930276 RepID=A0A517N175_9BACT|nr:short chain dehydrogenase [Adhaeretor mobilis]